MRAIPALSCLESAYMACVTATAHRSSNEMQLAIQLGDRQQGRHWSSDYNDPTVSQPAVPPKVADYYTEARLSLQLLHFLPGDCSVCSVLVLFAFLFLPPSPVSLSLLPCPSLQDGGSRVAQGKAPSHSSKSVSFYLLFCP